MSRNAPGEGSIYKRKDGRWAGAVFVPLTNGGRKRVQIYGATRADVHATLIERLRQAKRGVRTPARTWTFERYLDHWLTEVVAAKDRQTTLDNYRGLARNHLAPLGRYNLTNLTVQVLQAHLNELLAAGVGVRTIEATRSLVRAALSQAEREELVHRNVARLVQIPTSRPEPVVPWSEDEVTRFLHVARSHRWYAAYVLLLRLGLRRGEVLGLTWGDIDPMGESINVNRQLQRLVGRLQLVPLKTQASRRRLALVGDVADAMWQVPRDIDSDLGLIFTTTTGTPVDPRNFGRVFQQLSRKAGLRRIRLHHARHTAATLMKDAGVSPRDAQLILGHAHVSTTQQIYQHGDGQGQRQALMALDRATTAGRAAVKSAVNSDVSTGHSTEIDALTSGGPGGARTLDTLLKSLPRTTQLTPATSVGQHLLTRTCTWFIGRVAVNLCCQHGVDRRHVEDLCAVREFGRAARQQQLRQLSFPMSLLPPAV